MTRFGENLRICLARRKISQSELARRLGRRSPSSVNGWCHDKHVPPHEVVVKIARILGVAVEALYSGRMDEHELNENRAEARRVRLEIEGAVVEIRVWPTVSGQATSRDDLENTT